MDRVPATTHQHKLLLHHWLYPTDSAYNIASAYRVRGELDLERLREVMERLNGLARPMNLSFDPDGWARRHDRGGTVRIVDAPAADSPEAEDAAVGAWLGARADQPIRPDGWPLYQLDIVRGRWANYYCVLVSHLIADGVAMFNLGRLTSALYNGEVGWAEVAGRIHDDPYDFVGAEPPAASADTIAAFRELLAGVDRLAHDYLETPRVEGVLSGRQEQRLLAPAEAKAMFEGPLVAAYGQYPVLVAAYCVLLGGLTGQSRVVTGIPVANRRGLRQRSALGYYVNILPLSVDLDTYDSFGDLCKTVAERIPTLLRHQTFDIAAHAAGVFGGTPPNPVAVDNTVTFYSDRNPLQFADTTAEPVPVPRRQVRYPLAMNVFSTVDNLMIGLEYADRLAVAKPLDCLLHILATGLADPMTPPRQMSIVDPSEDSRIKQLTGRRHEYPTPDSLDAWFATTAAEHPDRVAITDQSGQYTYAELDAVVERVAQALRARRVGPYVAVAMRRRRDLVAVLLGVLRAGRAYVPLDPYAPRERVAQIAGQFDDLTLVADPDLLADTPVHSRFAAADILRGTDGLNFAELRHIAEDMETDPGPDRRSAPAYVIFTSGSTGVPKGVQVSQHNVMRLFTATASRFGFGPDDVWCLFHSYAFDFSVWEIFGALLHGGRLVIVDDQVVRSPEDFAALLSAEGVTVLNQTPSAFRRLTGVLTPGLAARLAVRWVVFGGEALHFDILRPWRDLVGDRARLVNMYGITETTVHTTFHEVEPAAIGAEAASVIGVPLPDLALAVVDRNLNRCPVGVPGELLIAGDGVAGGYLNRPDLTAQRFPRDTRYGEVVYRSGDLCRLRDDGTLVYLGRIDRQVQLRGHRIEPGEVESALRATGSVRDCHVGVYAPPGGEPVLVAWLISTDDGPSDAELRVALEHRLPRYMVPGRFVRLDALPLTVNGKVDSAALPAPVTAAPKTGVSAEATGVAGQVARIWADTIQCGQIGPDDNFFDVGGTSMHVAEVHRRVVAELGANDLAMVELFEFPTPRHLALRIEGAEPSLSREDNGTARDRRRNLTARRAARNA